MQTEFILNGGVTLMLSPENEAEEALLKQMMKQTNDLTEVRTSIAIIGKTFKNGVIISKRLVKEGPGLTIV